MGGAARGVPSIRLGIDLRGEQQCQRAEPQPRAVKGIRLTGVSTVDAAPS